MNRFTNAAILRKGYGRSIYEANLAITTPDENSLNSNDLPVGRTGRAIGDVVFIFAVDSWRFLDVVAVVTVVTMVAMVAMITVVVVHSRRFVTMDGVL